MATQLIDSSRKECNEHAPFVIHLLKKYGLHKNIIARTLNVDAHMVIRVLDPNVFAGCTYNNVLRIRRQTEAFLRAAGWRGKSSDLWSEYDTKLDAAA